MLRSNVFLFSFAARQEALRQNRGAQEEVVIEPPSGAKTRLTHRRDSDLIICFL